MSPPVTGAPAGVVRPLAGHGAGRHVRRGDRARWWCSARRERPIGASPTFAATGARAPCRCPAPATAMAGDGEGEVYLSTRGGYFRFDVAAGTATRIDVDGQQATDFTAIARRADGRLVLGSADGAVYTLGSDTAVGARLKIFARVDALVTQGNTAVVLDRGQTSVTTVDAGGTDAAARAAGRRGRHHDGRRSGRPGAGRRHPRRRAAGVRRRPADPAPALPGAGRPVRPGRLEPGWHGCRRRRRTPSLVTIWPPEYPSRRCVIEPCSNPTPWPSTTPRARCTWCPARERVSR